MGAEFCAVPLEREGSTDADCVGVAAEETSKTT
jgi:hypothetical protein